MIEINVWGRDDHGVSVVVAVTIVDDRDVHLALRRWYLQKGYVRANSPRMNGKRTPSVSLHRLVVDAPVGLEVDHIDGDKLNNRRENLRICTIAENRQNVPSNGGTSRYRGVCWYKRVGKWVAQVRVANKNYHLGYFDDEEAAATVARAFRETHMTHNNENRSVVT